MMSGVLSTAEEAVTLKLDFKEAILRLTEDDVPRERRYLFAAGDMPFLQTDLIRRLLAIARREDCDCVIPRNNEGFEPLHAVYDAVVVAEFERALRRDDLSIWSAFSRLNTMYVGTTPVERHSFFSINTKEDLKSAILYSQVPEASRS